MYKKITIIILQTVIRILLIIYVPLRDSLDQEYKYIILNMGYDSNIFHCQRITKK